MFSGFPMHVPHFIVITQYCLILLKQADAGGSGLVSSRKYGGVQAGGEQFVMKVPNNKVSLF